MIVLKAFAGRGQDWVDVEQIVARQAGKLDWDQVDAELKILAEVKGDPAIVDTLRRLGAAIE